MFRVLCSWCNIQKWVVFSFWIETIWLKASAMIMADPRKYRSRSQVNCNLFPTIAKTVLGPFLLLVCGTVSNTDFSYNITYVIAVTSLCSSAEGINKDTMSKYTPVTTSPSLYYSDVIMGAMASQSIILTIVYSGVDQRKHQSSASLAFVREVTDDRWIPRTNGECRGKWWRHQFIHNSISSIMSITTKCNIMKSIMPDLSKVCILSRIYVYAFVICRYINYNALYSVSQSCTNTQ